MPPEIASEMLTYLTKRADLTKLGQESHASYVANHPWPHIVIDNFIDPDLLEGVRVEAATIDGQTDVELENGDQVSVAASEHVARFARFQPRTYFYRTLVERLREREK